MRAHISCFWTQKGGNEPHEWEDAYAVADGSVVDDGEWDSTDPLRVAVADGASESYLAGRWAADLTARYAVSGNTDDVIREAIAGWPDLLERYRVEREERRKPIQWYEEPKMRAGAHATLVTARFADASEFDIAGSLTLSALGDACVFGVRDDKLLVSFPTLAASDFDASPPLIQSKPSDVELVVSRVRRRHLKWQSGDSYYLATDALSHWFLREWEAARRPWETLRDLGTNDAPDFGAWVTGLRSSSAMRNDDVTLVRVDVL